MASYLEQRIHASTSRDWNEPNRIAFETMPSRQEADGTARARYAEVGTAPSWCL
jgi:hypothetical protein